MPVPSMSSRLDNVSAVLGEYMLKGWTLTDLQCDTCNVTPLMREPLGAAQREGRTEPIQFCALCDGGPQPPQSANTNTGSRGPTHSTSTPTPTESFYLPGNPTASGRALETMSSARTSPAVTARTTRSPEDSANQISSLLLQGYSLLNENCPHRDTCPGVPLVGFPRRKDGTKDGKKLCVSCGGRWVDGDSLDGMVLLSGPGTLASSVSASQAEEMPGSGREAGSKMKKENPLESPRSKRRRELYEVGMMMVDEQRLGDSNGKGREIQKDTVPVKGEEEEEEEDLDMENYDEEKFVKPSIAANTSSIPKNGIAGSLQTATQSLTLTLDRLATSLSSHTAGTNKSDESRYFVDVKLHTEAMKDVLEVLGMVEKLRK